MHGMHGKLCNMILNVSLYYYMMQYQLAASAESSSNKFCFLSSSQAHLHAGGSLFPLFHYEIGSFQSIVYQVTATTNSPITFLACTFIFYIARITRMSLYADLLAH